MAATFPGGVKSFAAITDGDVIYANDPGDIQDEVTAIETDLLSGMAHALSPDGDYTRALGDATHRWTLPTVFKEVTTTSTGAVDNFDPSYVGNVLLRCNNASAMTLSGFVAGSAGAIIVVVSINAQVNLVHQAISTATNRLINFATSANTSLAAGSGVAVYQYDGTTARWRMIHHDQGAWITPTFAAGDYTAGWNTGVASGDVTTCRYKLEGRTLHWTVYIATATVVAAATLVRTLFGFTAAADFRGGFAYWDVATTASNGVYSCASTSITFYRDASGSTNWSNSTNQTYVEASGMVEVT